jgi:hypothetical protein
MKPKLILSASMQPFLSIGVRHGGMKLNGCEYKYFQDNDVFVRKDLVKTYKALRKQGFSISEIQTNI